MLTLILLISVFSQLILYKTSKWVKNAYNKKILYIAIALNLLLATRLYFIIFNPKSFNVIQMFAINPQYLKKLFLLPQNLSIMCNLGIYALVISILVSIIIIDFKYKEIPNQYNFVLFLLGIAFIFNNRNYISVVHYILGGVVLFVIFFVIMILTGALGFGDVKMVFGLGFITGLSLIPNFLIYSFGIGALVSILLIVFKVKKMQDKIAFGPYLAIGFLMIILKLV